jgi:hypothetical protein
MYASPEFVDQLMTAVSAVPLLYEYWRRSEFPVLKSVGEEEVMFMTSKRHGWLVSTLRLAPVIAIAAAAIIAMAPTDARAQSLNVKTFNCPGTSTTVTVDVSGLGSTNVCVDGSVSLNLNCACETNSGNCPNDQNKQTVPATAESQEVLEPKNGRVRTTVSISLPTSSDDDLCTTEAPALNCPSGQDEALVGFQTTSVTSWILCTTIAQVGEDCSCPDDPDDPTVLATDTCGTAPGQLIEFNDVGQDCRDLFP